MTEKELIPSAYSSAMQCDWQAWRVLASGELALDMPNENCCDMQAAVDIAEKLMPSVWRIATFSGGAPDTEYRNVRGEWLAFDVSANDQVQP